MQSSLSSTPPSSSLPNHFERALRTSISTPTSRLQPQSPSQIQNIHNQNPFSSNSASPFIPKDRTLHNIPTPKIPSTPPDSSGKTLVNIDIQPTPLGDPIDITLHSTTKDPSSLAHDTVIIATSSTIVGPGASSPPSASPSSPSRNFSKASPSDRQPAIGSTPAQSPARSTQNSRSSDTGFFASNSEASISSTDSVAAPNVYINGLPPNFPEEQLYNMTKEFGTIISVRTFTRHVSERPTGYGFVLFESLDAAEHCVETLRKYRNLHPSLSKQIHKIPGTVYANVQNPDVSQQNSEQGMSDSFKARMERFKDETSTNLYIEGLPLSIDEPTLVALMSPYKIMSSRLFQTRLSHPPRIIAFVRLETRSAAEEIIERLHGRMVRGWNDPGSRISVRFADTAEQRELRRQERTAQGQDNSPARLTIAQAALLNLQGSKALPLKQPRFGSRPSDGFASGPAQSHPLPLPYGQPAVNNPSRTIYGRTGDHGNRTSRNRRDEGLQMSHAKSPTAATARNGFTPAEELILAVHAQQVQSRSAPGIAGMIPSQEYYQNTFSASPHFAPPRATGMPGIDHMSHVGLQAIAEDQYIGEQAYGYEDDLRNSREQGIMERVPLGFEGLSISRSTTLPLDGGNNHSRTATTHGTFRNKNNSNISSPIKNTAGKPSINFNTRSMYSNNSHNIIERNSTGDVADNITYNNKEETNDSPLVSPALTYSSHGRTPQTLSPVTPLFIHGEAFEAPSMVGAHLKGKEKAVTTADTAEQL